ncbi:carboxymuconolactone decarboxylase family protein [Paraburkholderia fungorum]|jgi:4-carboxymuconolactone decarboxylase|uniref:carboxymuconolactone decarboxylase family protein n=1 Tax=Paraburkholderia fungorum TaxID=134537 RepID=UPI0038BB4D7F
MSDLPRIAPVTPGTRPELAAVEARINEARGQISPLYRILLNSAPVVDGWEAMLTAIRQKTSVTPRVRELTILRIAVMNHAPYEFDAHVAHAERAGVPHALMEQLRLGLPPEAIVDIDAGTRNVLRLVDAMTRDIEVPDAIFDPVCAEIGTTAMLELVATIAAYNMVSRLLVALRITH